MAGHSHAKNVRIRKAAVDSKRSSLFSKLSRMITIAAKGGGDPAMNPKLAFAVAKAKQYSLPKDTLEKAIKKGTGELESEALEEVLYEGYGPDGVAVLCEIVTDNRNRTASNVRKIFDVAGGNLGTTNCVAWMFNRKGQFLIDAEGKCEDELFELATEAGAENLERKGDYFEILCDMTEFDNVSAALSDAQVDPSEAELAYIPEHLVPCDASTGKKVVRLIDNLNDDDDVQNVFTNADIPDECYEDEA